MRVKPTVILMSLLLFGTALADAPRHRLTLSTSADNDSGRDSGVSYQLSTDDFSFFVGAYENDFAATFFDVDSRSFAESVEGQRYIGGLDAYFGDWGLHLGASLSDSEDGLEKDSLRFGVSYTGDRSNVRVQALSIEASQPLIVIAGLNPLQLRRIEDQRDGTGFAVDASWFLNQNWMLTGDVQRVWYDDPLAFITRDSFDVRTPLNSAQRLIEWSAAAGVTWFDEEAAASLVVETLAEQDDDLRTTSIFASLDVPLVANFSVGFVVGYSSTRDNASTAFGGIDLSLAF